MISQNKETVFSKQEKDLNDFIKTWTDKYVFCIKREDKENNIYAVEFSIPTKPFPIPQVSVIVHIYLDNQSEDLSRLKFRFDDEDLLHTLDSSMKFSSIELYIDDQIKNKYMVRDYYFLGTKFERTRIRDPRIDLLIEEEQIETNINEELSIQNKDLLNSKKKIKYINQDQIHSENLEIFKKKLQELYFLLDPNLLLYVSVDSFKRFLSILGINTENFDFKENFFYKYNPKKNGIVSFETIIENLSEILLSKFIFEIVAEDYTQKRELYEQQAIRLFYFQYKNILHKFRVFLHNLEIKGELSAENLKLNIGKIREKILTDEQYEVIINQINQLKLITRSFIPQLMTLICESKKEEYAEKMFQCQRNDFQNELLKIFKASNPLLTEQQFKQLLYNKQEIFIPKQQVGILWELLDHHGYVVDGQFNLEKHVYLIGTYLRRIITMKTFLKISFDPKNIDEQFYTNFEMPHNLSMLFLEKSPLNKQKAISTFYKYLNLNEEMVKFILDNFEKEQKTRDSRGNH